MKLPIKSLFNFGTLALYFDSTDKVITCQVFIDIGWSDESSRYESYVAETIILISILLEEIPVPKVGDQIQIDQVMYDVVSVHAQDELIALLHVKVLE